MLCFCSAVSDSGAQNRVFSSASFGIGVVGDLDLDHPVDVVGIAVLAASAPSLTAGMSLSLYSSSPLPEVQMKPSPARPAYLATDGSARSDVDGDATLGNVVDRRALGVVVLAVEVDAVAEPQFAHQLDRFAQPGEPLLELRPVTLVSGGDLVERLPGADAEEDPVRIQAAHRRERLRDDGGVVPERRRQHRRARAPGAWCARPPRSSTPVRTARGRPRDATAGSGH